MSLGILARVILENSRAHGPKSSRNVTKRLGGGAEKEVKRMVE